MCLLGNDGLTTLDPWHDRGQKRWVCSVEVSLLLVLDVDESLTSGHHVLVLDSHDTTTPLSGEVGVIIELGLELLAELLKIDEVFTTDFGESEAGGGLEVNKLTKVSLATDEAEGDTLLSAESGQMDDDLNGVDVVGDHDKLSLTLLNESSHVVETELDEERLVSLSSTLLSGSLQTLGLLLLGLGLVLSEQFKELGGCSE